MRCRVFSAPWVDIGTFQIKYQEREKGYRMNHIGTREIATERLTLRRFEIEDAENMFYNWANDPEVTKYLTWPAHESVDTTETILKEWISKYDEKDFPEFDKTEYSHIRQNVTSNFKDFGLYKTILNINDIDNIEDNAIGDALDDLTDIILDLLEIKWRIENNSLADGLWFFELIFYSHTQQHILYLLNFMKQKNG